eukprot:CAMPEP_0185187198 /NCGR_PEP_ID=MMETSP1140-20130426/4578_1 /TAXON_ID=298111 /ORGANISM="Pavlova sp., Strain CCMP459" /LENGTH=86 /DNA_ID=CAMNT_0027753559 /DNA_START=75 /DNA_END=332 /DNA_ORIENTATION=+
MALASVLRSGAVLIVVALTRMVPAGLGASRGQAPLLPPSQAGFWVLFCLPSPSPPLRPGQTVGGSGCRRPAPRRAAFGRAVASPCA